MTFDGPFHDGILVVLKGLLNVVPTLMIDFSCLFWWLYDVLVDGFYDYFECDIGFYDYVFYGWCGGGYLFSLSFRDNVHWWWFSWMLASDSMMMLNVCTY